MANNIRDLVDTKFVITRTIGNQAEAGTVVHIMNANGGANGCSIDYRVTATGQNYNIQFKSLGDFYKWARSDSFITRNHDSFTKDEIMQYLKVTGRTFASFCVPLIILALAVIWTIALLLLKGVATWIVGIAGSVVSAAVIIILFKRQKSDIKMKMYYKLGSSKWGVKFK